MEEAAVDNLQSFPTVKAPTREPCSASQIYKDKIHTLKTSNNNNNNNNIIFIQVKTCSAHNGLLLSLQLSLYYWRRSWPDTFSIIFLRRYCICWYTLSWFVWLFIHRRTLVRLLIDYDTVMADTLVMQMQVVLQK